MAHVICRTTVTKFTGCATEMFMFQLNVYTVAFSLQQLIVIIEWLRLNIWGFLMLTASWGMPAQFTSVWRVACVVVACEHARVLFWEICQKTGTEWFRLSVDLTHDCIYPPTSLGKCFLVNLIKKVSDDITLEAPGNKFLILLLVTSLFLRYVSSYFDIR